MYISQVSADVPSYEVLADYQPPLMTRVHADDGELEAAQHQLRLALASDHARPLLCGIS